MIKHLQNNTYISPLHEQLAQCSHQQWVNSILFNMFRNGKPYELVSVYILSILGVILKLNVYVYNPFPY